MNQVCYLLLVRSVCIQKEKKINKHIMYNNIKILLLFLLLSDNIEKPLKCNCKMYCSDIIYIYNKII